MEETSKAYSELAEELDSEFEEAYQKGDKIGSAFSAMDSIKARQKARELYKQEHPELEYLKEINQGITMLISNSNVSGLLQAVTVVLLGVILYKLW
jgi:preprotein translocase subunit Sec63